MTDQNTVSQADKCTAFANLHKEPGGFIIPNPWDIGSAKILQSLGFKALATTSAGIAHTLGRTDGMVTLEEKLDHCRALASNTRVPINTDFENGFADAPEAVAANIARLAETGVAGCSIEDYSSDSKSLYDFDLAVERIQAAVEAVAALGMPFQLTARSENYLRGNPNMEDTLKRLNAFEEAGADVLFAPGINTLDQLREITGATSKPFNVLNVFFPDVTAAEFIEAGAKRISVGSALNLITINPLIRAGKEMLENGSFSWTGEMASGGELAKLLR